MKKRLILAGAGHAHLIVLEQLAQHKGEDLEIVLITPSPWQYYSGMLPGWISGQYREEDCRIDIRPLAERARAKLVLEPVAAMNADRNVVCFADGRHLEYDLLSLDTGSETNNDWLASLSGKLLPAKPLDEFSAQWPKVVAEAKEKQDFRLVVVGGGAAGVELALATRSALSSVTDKALVTLVISRSGLLQGHGKWMQRRALSALEKSGIPVIAERAVGTENGVYLSNDQSLTADRVIAATGARAAAWLELSKLKLDKLGFVEVDSFQRSFSHTNVFAVGDVSSRTDTPVARSGVHAVRAGPVLAHNLMAVSQGNPLKPYVPRRRSLYILASGRGRAIASWGALSVEGKWVWRWKDAIDREFINRFRMDHK
jgi:pyridine nucleotide-disulfide oxidoreductase family protein